MFSALNKETKEANKKAIKQRPIKSISKKNLLFLSCLIKNTRKNSIIKTLKEDKSIPLTGLRAI